MKLTLKKYLSYSFFSIILFSLVLSIYKSSPRFVYAEEISFFRASPRLARTHTTFTLPNVISTYIFEIEIPQNAVNSLQKIVINQQTNMETIDFFPDQTKAFIINNNQQKINVTAINNLSDNKNELIIELEPSIPSGNTLKLEVKTRNPLYGGIYQYGVTTYPQGNNPRGLYLGIARFHFDQPGGRF
ncbi:hypothetical protein Cyan10605_3525 (plasmid) [Cyanobacterium aponinum PCC 10605]|uniref:DUF2808 domain-containing protein n=1 Tax=Cyanobacterium aponinum (strain PCC 10605) TaxID=755178 RepID=K9ZAZ9_CYAAP|nr:hypothetical protein Cyan10605_3525 [Cyanobacterium aponinum PCC 10605]